MIDHVEMSHVTKFDTFRVSSDLIRDFETWFKNDDDECHREYHKDLKKILRV